ncbi:MAG: hypothetical protein U9R72_10915 [Chloroflexota bacterium]|nr:hypothetical protein [Chloroflexota bacterium]
MTRLNRSEWPLTPSQQEQYDAIRTTLTKIRGRHRPFLLTGDVGVGKTFLACRLANQSAAYHNIAQDYLSELLTRRRLSDLTPEAVVRFVKALLKNGEAPYAIADGFEPLLSMWAVESAKVLPNFLVAFSRAILDQPLLVVVQTSADHLPYAVVRKDALWPSERRFRLDLTLADKKTVARNWDLDPMRAQVSANLYKLLTWRTDA